jgi:hypothetical protein
VGLSCSAEGSCILQVLLHTWQILILRKTSMVIEGVTLCRHWPLPPPGSRNDEHKTFACMSYQAHHRNGSRQTQARPSEGACNEPGPPTCPLYWTDSSIGSHIFKPGVPSEHVSR